MGRMKEHFGTYPDRPGWKGTDTSAESADKIEPRAGTLRQMAFDHIRSQGWSGATADETAWALNQTVLAIRPRITELKKTGRIEPNGEKRENVSGHRADVLIATGLDRLL